MKFPIGFNFMQKNREDENKIDSRIADSFEPKKSIARIYFAHIGKAYSYYNDKFDLSVGNLVYVDGKLSGNLGKVISINYNFKIKPSDYQKVISVAKTHVLGEVYISSNGIYAFDKNVIGYGKVLSWLKPINDDDEFVIGYDDTAFLLDDLEAEFCIDDDNIPYYRNEVLYLEVDNEHGRAIIDSDGLREVEFDLIDRNVTKLVCSCYECGNCTHEYAVLKLLRKCLEEIEQKFSDNSSKYFALIDKELFEKFAYTDKSKGRVILEE